MSTSNTGVTFLAGLARFADVSAIGGASVTG
jgi:hypothetical protein